MGRSIALPTLKEPMDSSMICAFTCAEDAFQSMLVAKKFNGWPWWETCSNWSTIKARDTSTARLSPSE